MRRHVLHWLDVSGRIKFCLCVTDYKCVHGMVLGYLGQRCADQFLHFKDDVNCVLLVASILTFLVSYVPLMESGRLPTLAGPSAWNSLPDYLRHNSLYQPLSFSV